MPVAEDPRATSTSPGHVAVGLVHEDPPRVLVAADEQVLSRLIALEIVCEEDPASLEPGALADIRAALLEEDWAAAVRAWIEATGVRVDVHPDEPVMRGSEFTAGEASFDIRLSRLFES